MARSIGFIGLGNIGQHLATSVVRAGYDVVLHDLDRGRATELLNLGASWAQNPREVAGAAEVVITCLPSPGAVRNVMTGEHGVIAGMSAGSTWIEMSTNDRAEVQALAELAARRGAVSLEAPVTGGVHLAAAAEMTVLVAGPQEAYEANRGIFEAVGKKVFYMGALGDASVMKVITNMLAFIHLVAVGEALMLAKRGGLDLGTAYEAIAASSGNSFVHETEGQVILSGSYNIEFTLDLACKDLSFASDMARDFGVPLELEKLAQQTFERARSEYGGSAWSPTVVKLLEDTVGVELRAPGFPEILSGQNR